MDPLKSFSHNQRFIIGKVVEHDPTYCKVKIKDGIQKTGFLFCLATGHKGISAIDRLPKVGSTVAAITFDPFLQVGLVLGSILTEEQKDIYLDGDSLESTIKSILMKQIKELKIGDGLMGNVVTTQCICHFTGSPHGVGAKIAQVGGVVGP